MDDSIRMFKYMIVKVLQYFLVAYYEIKYYWQHASHPKAPDRIKIENPYSGQTVLLMALYQQHHLRPDVKRFLQIAKRAGLYLIGVNTAALSENVEGIFDCYIERDNIGRDFGSYKAGFEFIYAKGYHRQIPRLLMMNDSVFYESSRSEPFLEQMINTDKAVLGATENFEVQYHLGSFCISMSGNIIQQDKFKQFWKNYRNSDIRIVVIEKGEAALSACLRQCVSLPEETCAAYSMLFVDKVLTEDPQNASAALRLARKGVFPGWPNISLETLWSDFVTQHYLGTCVLFPSDATDVYAVEECIQTALHTPDERLPSMFNTYLHGYLLDTFRVGSQIHQNNAFLMYLGLPLVKLDGVYRGMFVKADVDTLGSLMSPQEASELEKLLMSKPFWQDNVKNGRKWLYLLGIL